MKSLWHLTFKNLRLLLRAKSSALIIIFAPLLIMLILGLSYNSSSTRLNIGVHAPSFTEDVESFMSLLQEQEFKIVKYEDSIEECVEDIKLGAVHSCIDLPESLQVTSNQPQEVVFYLDSSRINLVWMIQETVKSKFNFKAQQLSQEISGNIVRILSESKSAIAQKSPELQSIKEKTSVAASSAESVKSSLSGLDVTTPTVSYDKSPLTNATSSVKEAKLNISAAIDALDSTNLSGSDKTTIENALNGADTSLASALAKLEGSSGTVQGIIDSLEIDLGAAYKKLSSASTAIGTSTSDLGGVHTSLNEASASLESVLGTLQQLQTTLESQQITDPSTIAAPLTTTIKRVGEESTFLDYLFPTLLTLVVMFTSLLLGTTLVMMEKTSPAYLRNFFLPLRKIEFITATYLTNLILIIIQLVIILGVSLFFLTEALPLLPMVFLILLIAASVFTFLGMALGYLFTSEETGVLASISLGSMLLFISGVILPLESISPLLREIVFFNPFVITEKLLREVFIFNSSFSLMMVDFVILIGYALILFFVILVAESILHKNLVHRFLRHHHKLHRQKDKQNKNDV